MGRGDPEHALALVEALRRGCTLIDTASNYMDGDSETLVGEILEQTGLQAQVVTKAGYVTRTELGWFGSTDHRHAAGELSVRPGRSPHCIHPDFLQAQIARSLGRLGRTSIDGFLLHNPEHQFSGDESADTVLTRIARAFEFLEDLAERGVIGVYGVSSNTIFPTRAPPGALALDELVRVAASVAADHRFRLVQFPANLIERRAFEPQDGENLVEAVRSNGLVSLANRPLNAVVDGQPLRLATSVDPRPGGDARAASTALDLLVARVNERLETLNVEPEAEELPLLRAFRARLDDVESTEDPQSLFEAPTMLFLDQLYSDSPPSDVIGAMSEIRCYLRARTRAAMNARARAMRDRLVAEGRIAADDPRELQLVACCSLLDAGFDHVLVGMRRRAYVHSLAPLLGAGDERRMGTALSARKL